MGILPWVMGILLVLSCTAWIEFRQLVETTFIVTVDIQAIQAEFNEKFDVVKERSEYIYKSLLKKENNSNMGNKSFSPPPAVPTPTSTKRRSSRDLERDDDDIVPDEKAIPSKGAAKKIPGSHGVKLTRRVHFNELFTGQEGSKRKEIEKKIFVRLLQNNYQPLFELSSERSRTAKPDLFSEQIVDALIEEITRCREIITVKEPERLANFKLYDESLSYAFFRILKGGNLSSTLVDVKAPSLLKIISLQPRKEILSIYLAPRIVLNSICDDQKNVESIIMERNAIYKKLKADSDSISSAQDKASLEADFSSRVSSLISRDIESSYIDFSISKTAPPR